MTSAKVVAITKPLVEGVDSASDFVAYIARVSNPENQLNSLTYEKLLNYLETNNHLSPYEHSFATVEVITTRDIARQMLRHRSFYFQEFSQRYAKAPGFIIEKNARRQDTKNRQNSIDDMDKDIKDWFEGAIEDIVGTASYWYNKALEMGIAKECARIFLPEGLTESRLYMTGNFRSWMHYLALRSGNGTQMEHREVAESIRRALGEQERIFEMVKS